MVNVRAWGQTKIKLILTLLEIITVNSQWGFQRLGFFVFVGVEFTVRIKLVVQCLGVQFYIMI